jgi:hypothetical protein
MDSSIGWEPHIMKRRSLVEIFLPLLREHVKKRKEKGEVFSYTGQQPKLLFVNISKYRSKAAQSPLGRVFN